MQTNFFTLKFKGLTLLGAILILSVSAATAGAAGNLLPEGLKIENTYQHGFGQSVGRILLVQGEVIVIHKDESVGYRVKKNMPVYKLDTLISLKRGRCLIKMNDRSRLTLSSRTKITVNRSIYKAKKRERSSFFKMAVGKARFWVTKLAEARRSEFKIRAATAVVGIRGSDFLIEIIEEKPQYSSNEFDHLTASLATDLALNDPPAGLGVRITALTPETILDATSVVDPELSVRLEGLQQVEFSPDALPSDVMDISPEDATDIMGDMPVDIESFQQLPQVPAVTGQPAGQTGGGAGEVKDEGDGGEGKDEGGEGEQGTPAATSGEAPADQADAGGAAEPAESGDGATGEPESGAPAEEPGAGAPPATEPEGAGAEPEAPLTGAPEPEIFVDQGDLIVPDAIGEEVEIPAPIEPEVDEIVNQEQVESVQDTQTDIVQEIYEEVVAGELPDFPDTPQP